MHLCKVCYENYGNFPFYSFKCSSINMMLNIHTKNFILPHERVLPTIYSSLKILIIVLHVSILVPFLMKLNEKTHTCAFKTIEARKKSVLFEPPVIFFRSHEQWTAAAFATQNVVPQLRKCKTIEVDLLFFKINEAKSVEHVNYSCFKFAE